MILILVGGSLYWFVEKNTTSRAPCGVGVALLVLGSIAEYARKQRSEPEQEAEESREP